MIDAERLARRLADAADVFLPLPHGPVVLQGQPVAAGATLVAMVRVGRAAAALARVIDLPARGPACLSEIFEKPQVERVLLARPERWLLKLFGWLFVVWLFVWLLVFWRLLFICRRAGAHGPAHP